MSVPCVATAAKPQRQESLQQGPPHFAERLVVWQRSHGRHDLPWQTSTDPYRVWLSEIMLQQTQVAVVLTYYPRFLQRFPTVQALAEASEDDVLAQWSGLGYYRRARNLHRCAQQIYQEHGGDFPRTAQGLRQLAGIGRSTAAAIAAFCFGEHAAILDGNVKRVLGRSHALPASASTAAELRALWNLAERLLPRHDIQAYTQGLMDLGATVCKPRNPSCLQCPFQSDCRTRQSGPGAAPLFDATHGSAQQRTRGSPVKAVKARRTQTWVLLWAENVQADSASIWLERRATTGIWPGLWCLPQFDSHEQALRHAAQLGVLTGHSLRPVTRHALTHVDLQLEPLQVRITPTLGAREAGSAWFTLPEALTLGLPAPVRRLLQTAASSVKLQGGPQTLAPA